MALPFHTFSINNSTLYGRVFNRTNRSREAPRTVAAWIDFVRRIISDIGVKSRARRAFVVARRLFPRRDMGLRMMEEGTSPVSAKKFSRRAF
jgi:hypothetical protein